MYNNVKFRFFQKRSRLMIYDVISYEERRLKKVSK